MADRETEPRARSTGGMRAPIELLEDARLLAGREPFPSVGDLEAKLLRADSRVDFNGTAGRGVLMRVLDEVPYHLFEEHIVHRDERKVVLEGDLDLSTRQLGPEPCQGGTDDLLDRVPLLLHAESAGLQPRHIE